MKDASSGQPVDSAEIIHGKFAFADTVTIVSPVVKVLSICASKSGLEYRLPVVIEMVVSKPIFPMWFVREEQC